MQPEPVQASPAPQLIPASVHVARLDGHADRRGEHQPVLPPGLTQRLALSVLPFLVLLKVAYSEPHLALASTALTAASPLVYAAESSRTRSSAAHTAPRAPRQRRRSALAARAGPHASSAVVRRLLRQQTGSLAGASSPLSGSWEPRTAGQRVALAGSCTGSLR